MSESIQATRDAPQEEQLTWHMIYLGVLVNAGVFLIGYDGGIINGALVGISKEGGRNGMARELGLDDQQQQLATTIILMGGMSVLTVAGVLADKLGRRPLVRWVNLLYIGGSVVSAITSNFWILIASRFVVGIATGISGLVSPLYMTEAAPQHARGIFVGGAQLMITAGYLTSLLVSYGLQFVDHGWRYMCLSPALPAIIIGIGSIFMPESPRWLVARGRVAEARSMLQSCRGGGTGIEDELLAMQAAVVADRKPKESVCASLGSIWTYKWLLVVSAVPVAMQELGGIDVVLSYSARIFEYAGVDDPILPAAALGAVNLLATVMAAKVIDRVGRRVLMLCSLFAMMAFMSGLATVLWLHENPGLLSVVMLVLYTAAFGFGMGIVPMVFAGEILPSSIRGNGIAMLTFLNNTLNAGLNLNFLTLTEFLGGGDSLLARRKGAAIVFWGLSGFSFLGLIFIFIFTPETRGRSLEDLETDALTNSSYTPREKPRRHSSVQQPLLA